MTQRQVLLRRTAKIIAVLTLFAILLCQNGVVLASPSPRSADVFREEITIHSKQLINDPAFDLGTGASPWSVTYDGDRSDVDGKIVGSLANSMIVGNETTFTLKEIPKAGSWIVKNNTYDEKRYYLPDGYEIDAYGCNASTNFGEDGFQTPSIWWVQNFTAPVNMSDYTIIAANVSAIVNATVSTNIDVLNIIWDDPEGGAGAAEPEPHGPPFDSVRFYVSVADTNLTNIRECAWNQTSDLGWYNTSYEGQLMDKTKMGDTYLDKVSETELIHNLHQVLAEDHLNFSVILGLDFTCADNCQHDHDDFLSIRIKSVSLNFTCQKKVNQNTAINWVETGYRINSTEYLGEGDEIKIDILNATLNFKYRLTQSWPITYNAEMRAIINTFPLDDTIELRSMTTSFQEVKGGKGFDVSALISHDQDVSISIQVVIVQNDYFLLPQNYSLLLDDVSLTVYFKATVKINTTTGGFPLWAIYLLLAVIAVIGGLFLEYMLVWKYPPHIRAIRSLIRGLKRGNINRMKTPTIFRSAEASMTDGFLQSSDPNLSLSAQTRLKFKYKLKKKEEKSKREVKGALTQTPPVKPIPQPTPLTTSKFPPAPSPKPLSTPPPTQQRAPVSTPLPQNVPPRPQVRLPAETTPKPRQSGGLPPVKELPDYKAKLKPAPKPRGKG